MVPKNFFSHIFIATVSGNVLIFFNNCHFILTGLSILNVQNIITLRSACIKD